MAGDGNPTVVDPNGCKATAADLHLRRDQIHEARQIRNAEAEDPGVIERTVSDIVERREEAAKAKVKAAVAPPKPEMRETARVAKSAASLFRRLSPFAAFNGRGFVDMPLNQFGHIRQAHPNSTCFRVGLHHEREIKRRGLVPSVGSGAGGGNRNKRRNSSQL